MLTRKQFELLRFIHERLTEAGVPPSFNVLDEQTARETMAQARARVLERAGDGDAILASAHVGHRCGAQLHARTGHASALGATKKYRIQAHYLVHDCWLGERRLLSLARRAGLAGVPFAAVHGLRDPVCPPSNLDRLARAVPDVRVTRVQAGHLGSEPALAASLTEAIEAVFG